MEQASEERGKFRVLVFDRGDSEDFELKGYDIAAQAVASLNDESYLLIFVGAPKGKEEEVRNNLLKCGISRSQLIVRGFIDSRGELEKLRSVRRIYFSHYAVTNRRFRSRSTRSSFRWPPHFGG